MYGYSTPRYPTATRRAAASRHPDRATRRVRASTASSFMRKTDRKIATSGNIDAFVRRARAARTPPRTPRTHAPHDARLWTVITQQLPHGDERCEVQRVEQ